MNKRQLSLEILSHLRKAVKRSSSVPWTAEGSGIDQWMRSGLPGKIGQLSFA